jgi:hypothetical protein
MAGDSLHRRRQHFTKGEMAMQQVGIEQMQVEKVEVVKGLTIDKRLKLSGIAKMEKRFSLPFSKFDQLSTKIETLQDMIDVILILAQQHDKTVTVEKVQELLDGVSAVDALKAMSDALVQSLAVDAKN